MSRIGKRELVIPENVTIDINGDNLVKIKGSLGELSYQMNSMIEAKVEDGKVNFLNQNKSRRDAKFANSIFGTTNSIVKNMLEGVSKGFKKELKIIGVGYKARLEGNKLVLALGFSHPVEFLVPNRVKIEVPKPTEIIVSGIDKEYVGNVAATIRDYKKPEPYGGKGIRYVDEYVIRKVGKQSK